LEHAKRISNHLTSKISIYRDQIDELIEKTLVCISVEILKMRKSFLFPIAVLFTSVAVCQNIKPDSTAGIWKGSSLCQIKNSPCHDEVVVYHVSKGKTSNAYDIEANKIVNGAEEEMGLLHFKWDAAKKELSSPEYGEWTFEVDGDKMHGKLMVKGELYRLIELVKLQ
jgi:hypothetical protein